MKIFSPACFLVLANSSLRGVLASNLRSATKECTISAISYLLIPGETSMAGGDEEYGCQDNGGSFIPLHLDEVQKNSLRGLAASGKVKYGQSKIDIQGATMNNDGSITLPNGKDISAKPISNLFGRRNQRDLQAGTGDKHFLLFRVTDSQGRVHQDTAQEMSNNLFGSYDVDQINLKSQMFACSNENYNVIPGSRSGYDTSSIESAPGVVEITIDVSLNNPISTVRDAAFRAAKEKLGTTSLTTYADHTLFSLEACYQDCGWAAYAGVGSYYQFYQGNYYAMAGVQVHETGHNLYLAHSGGLDGQTYTDHTCSMGNPLYGDDMGAMCFNPAKTWQLQLYPHANVPSSWYDSQDFITVDTSAGAQAFEMIGIGEYKLNNLHRAVALQVKSVSGPDQYIAFNSAKGANFQNDEADDQVTIVEWAAGGYSTSLLKGYIKQGESFNLSKGKRGKVVTAQCIDTTVTPSVACVCIREDGQTCPNLCSCVEPSDCAQINAPRDCRQTSGCTWNRNAEVCESI